MSAAVSALNLSLDALGIVSLGLHSLVYFVACFFQCLVCFCGALVVHIHCCVNSSEGLMGIGRRASR